MPDVQLALVGSMATDDPEGWDFFNATIAHADGDPDIHILNNFNNVGAIEVNAFQSHSDVLIQKSTREGFGLTVSRGDLEGAAVHRRQRRRHPAAGRGRRHRLPRRHASRSAPQRALEILQRPGARQARSAARGKEHVRTHFLMPRYLRDYLRIFTELLEGRAAEPDDAAPAGAGLQPRARSRSSDDGEVAARHGRPGDGADRPGVAPRGDLDRLGDDRGRRARRARARRHGRSPSRSPDGRRVPGAARRVRPRGLRPLLQRLREPDAVVHPALPLGPVATRRTSAATRSRRSSSATTSSTRTSRARCVEEIEDVERAGRDGPRLPPLHAAGARPPRAAGRRSCTTSSTSRGRSRTPGACCPTRIREEIFDGPAGQRHHRLPHALLPAQLPAVLPRPDGPRGRLRARASCSFDGPRGVGARLPAADRRARRRGAVAQRERVARVRGASCCAAGAST